MTPRARMLGFLVAGAGFAALLFWALVGLPDFGHYHWPYGNALNAIATPERHTTNVVGATVFDYRGFDTLGEEFILFASVVGVALLLRKDEQKRVPADVVVATLFARSARSASCSCSSLGSGSSRSGSSLRAAGSRAGSRSLARSSWSTLVGGYRQYHELLPHSPVEMTEAAGAGAFAILGFVGLAYAGAYLGNFLGIGNAGSLYSGGSIPLLNWATGIEVCAALLVLFSEFLKVYMVPVADWTPEKGPR